MTSETLNSSIKSAPDKEIQFPKWLLSFTYISFQCFYRVIFKLVFCAKAYGKENIDESKASILVGNHCSHLDPPVIGMYWRKKLHFVGRSNLGKNICTKLILKAQNIIFLNRDNLELHTYKTITKLLKSGNTVVMFPEGTRSLDGNVGNGKEGLGLFVIKCKASVFPTYIHGTFKSFPKGAKFPKPAKISIHYGKEIPFDTFAGTHDNKEGYQYITDYVMNRIREMREEVLKKAY